NKTALKLNNINLKFLENPYINEKSKSGLATAVALAEQYIDNNFLVMLGDEIYYNSKHKEMLEYYKNSNFDGLIGYKIIDDKDAIKKNYSLKFNDKSQIIELIEKPEIIENNFLGCGTYIFKKDFFEFLKNCPVSKRTGKCELADSIMLYIQSGAIIGGFDLNGYYMNINYIADLAAAQEYAKKIEI
ncbi:MAG TPA: sugar phosphate nucleotidyltransferase, partial [bacterium]|nr:sugar phosphate nucleotidyltransferase [bacterium]